MGIGVMAAEIIFADGLSKVQSLSAGMQIHTLITAGGNPLFEYVYQILLKGLQTGHGHVESAFLSDYGASGVVGVNNHDTVLDAGLSGQFFYLIGYVVKANGAITGLQFKRLSEYHSFHLKRSAFSDRLLHVW
jgi:hypothetical protein